MKLDNISRTTVMCLVFNGWQIKSHLNLNRCSVTQPRDGYFLQSCVLLLPAQLCPQDFLIMFLHHVATISLITFSYVNNMARVGTLVMCLHDAADVLIEVRVCEGIKCCGWRDVWVEGLGSESSAVHLCISNTF